MGAVSVRRTRVAGSRQGAADALYAAPHMAAPLILRVILRDAPVGVAFALRLARDGLQPPTARAVDRIVFEARVETAVTTGGVFRLSGVVLQGPPSARFLYVNSGKRAGDARSCWDRRAKVSLAGIGADLLAQAQAGGGVLQTEIAGTSEDGGPCCATVPLIGGWRCARGARLPQVRADLSQDRGVVPVDALRYEKAVAELDDGDDVHRDAPTRRGDAREQPRHLS